jgi:hypothetical protein
MKMALDEPWIPAFAGMTDAGVTVPDPGPVTPAEAGSR